MKKLLLVLGISLSFLPFSQAAMAQGVTTGAMGGTVVIGKLEKKVITKTDTPLPGARIEAIHLPSGTKYGATVRPNGRYTIRGMRVGGPYKVTAKYVGYQSQEQSGISVALGDEVTVNFVLTEEGSKTEEVVITAIKSSIFNASKNGSGSTISKEEIEAAPTINRSISDFARLNPLATQVNNVGGGDGLAGISVGGQNTRFNNFQIDGAVANDMFGLGEAGTAGSQAGTNFISLDAIAELQVSASPYDVRQSGFTGGLINAITKAGTNKFEGSVFTFGRNQDLVGLSPDRLRQSFSDFSDFQFGGRVGGPIIEDKVFFHVTAELRQRRNPIQVTINDANAAINFPVPRTTIDSIAQIARDKYGYDAGTADEFTPRSNSLNVIARLDWNINENHRLQFRHNFTDAFQDRNVSRNDFNYSLTSQWNEFQSLNNSSVLELNSVLGENMSNMFRASYTVTNDERVLQAGLFPQVSVYVGNRQVIMGPERSSAANALDQQQLALTNDFSMYLGDHTITIGTHNEFYWFNNLFIQNFYGNYQFPSVEAFAEGLPNFYEVAWANPNTIPAGTLPRAKWSMMQAGLYVQDEWNVLPELRVNLGIRADIPIYFTEPYNNPRFAEVFTGSSTSQLPATAVMLSPRVGFNYDVSKGQRTTQIRGGSGIFTGRVAAVWLSNQYSNTGMDILRAEVGTRGANQNVPRIINGDTLRFYPDVNNPQRPGDPRYPGGASAIPTAEINITDENFKMPQVWRSTLAIDHQIIPGLTATIEGMYSLQLNQVDYANINLRRSGSFNGVSPLDGRPLYATLARDSVVAREFTNVITLKNRTEGYQYSIMGQLQLDNRNEYIPGLQATIAYTNSAAYDLNQGSNSTAGSQWRNTVADDPNNTIVGFSNFDVTHRIMANLSYSLRWAKGFETTIGVFYSGNSGRPYSLRYFNDVNGDGVATNDLVYIPTADDFGNKVVMEQFGNTDLRTPQDIWQELMAFIDANPTIKEYQGKIMPRNTLREPWFHEVDLRITQNLPGFGNQRVQITLDVQNFLNLLNGDWGRREFRDFQNLGFLGFNGFDENGRARLTFNTPTNIFEVDNFLSRWRMQLGVRYTF